MPLLSGSSQAVRFRGIALACFGDDPTRLISGRRILAGNIFNNSTFAYSVDTNSWTQAATKVYNDRSDEESWAGIAGGGILTYDLFQSVAASQGYAEIYDSKQNILDSHQSRRRLGRRKPARSNWPGPGL